MNFLLLSSNFESHALLFYFPETVEISRNIKWPSGYYYFYFSSIIHRIFWSRNCSGRHSISNVFRSRQNGMVGKPKVHYCVPIQGKRYIKKRYKKVQKGTKKSWQWNCSARHQSTCFTISSSHFHWKTVAMVAIYTR